MVQNRLLVFDCKEIRRELFKLDFPQTNFVLNDTADATETMETIFKLIHGASIADPSVKDKDRFNEMPCKPDCASHELFKLQV